MPGVDPHSGSKVWKAADRDGVKRGKKSNRAPGRAADGSFPQPKESPQPWVSLVGCCCATNSFDQELLEISWRPRRVPATRAISHRGKCANSTLAAQRDAGQILAQAEQIKESPFAEVHRTTRPSSSAQFCTMTIGKSSLFSTMRNRRPSGATSSR